MIATPVAVLRGRAEALREGIGDAVDIAEPRSTVGGGSLPGETLPSVGLAIGGRSPDRRLAHLRRGEPPVIGRIEDDRVVLDLRTVDPARDRDLATAVGRALDAPP